MKRLDEKAIRASMDYAKDISKSGVVEIKYHPKYEKLMIKYKRWTAVPKEHFETEGILTIVGNFTKLSGSNENFVNYITEKLK